MLNVTIVIVIIITNELIPVTPSRQRCRGTLHSHQLNTEMSSAITRVQKGVPKSWGTCRERARNKNETSVRNW